MAAILITGGAGDIGSAIAKAVAAQGDTPVLADLNLDRAQERAAEIDGASAARLDVTDAAECDRVIAEVVERHGRIDGVVCCAALFAFSGALDVTADDFERTLRVNVTGSLLPCQSAARAMIAAGHGGSMVLFSSGAGQRAVGAPAYSTSKGAVDALTRELATGFAPHGIRVNAVAPGVIDSDMSSDAKGDPEKFQWFMNHTPMRRMGRTDEVASTVAFLLGDASSYITAAVIPTDGGFLSH